ncbi:MAG: KpsF/GutQ family sugar-phosphate isomerase [Candidatus Wallbacteria bacterium]|nr:KpsF/GutQ family sugar-phosphate isomerase [Candidatus Wallbacteria bacterium]
MIELAKSVLESESQAILRLRGFLDGRFNEAVKMIDGCEGTLIVSGMGKSGLIGRKISATFASLGVSSAFMHPAEAIHGDLGMIREKDVILALSNSGETQEVIRLVPFIRRLGGRIISLVGNLDSFLSRNSDLAIYCGVEKEACPLNLAPTSSTTAMLAMGDALAIAVARVRNVQEQDFAKFHPGGSLGQKLLNRVRDVMHTGDRIPRVKSSQPLSDALIEITNKGFGFTLVTEGADLLAGILTDGDLRRILQSGKFELSMPVSGYMSRKPKSIKGETLIADALEMMEKFSITALVVVERDTPEGIVHLHDLLGRGNIRIEL